MSTSPTSSSTLQPIWKIITNSPPKPFLLPVYAQDLAEEFIRAPPTTSRSRTFRGDPKVLQFVDDAADCDNHVATSDDTLD